MRQALLEKFTEIGDPTLLLLGGLALFFHLWSREERRPLARDWAIAFGLCVLLTLFGKFVLHLAGAGAPGPFRLRSPSGHVAIGTVFYGGCAMIFAASRGPVARVLIHGATAALLGLLAASRLMLGLHSVAEVAAAFAIGGFCLAVLAVRRGQRRPVAVDVRGAVALLLLIGVAHYCRVDGEALIGRLAQGVDQAAGSGLRRAAEAGSGPIGQLGVLLERTFGRAGGDYGR
jgi:membrane-associated phospholipid phosphatase